MELPRASLRGRDSSSESAAAGGGALDGLWEAIGGEEGCDVRSWQLLAPPHSHCLRPLPPLSAHPPPPAAKDATLCALEAAAAAADTVGAAAASDAARRRAHVTAACDADDAAMARELGSLHTQAAALAAAVRLRRAEADGALGRARALCEDLSSLSLHPGLPAQPASDDGRGDDASLSPARGAGPVLLAVLRREVSSTSGTPRLPTLRTPHASRTTGTPSRDASGVGRVARPGHAGRRRGGIPEASRGAAAAAVACALPAPLCLARPPPLPRDACRARGLHRTPCASDMWQRQSASAHSSSRSSSKSSKSKSSGGKRRRHRLCEQSTMLSLPV